MTAHACSARLPPATPTEVPMRLIGLVAVALSIAVSSLTAAAQIGFLNVGARESFVQLLTNFEQRMARLGYVSGKDFSVVSRFADSPADLFGLAQEFVRLRPELILVQGNVVTATVGQATTNVPIVMTGVTDPVVLASSRAWRGPRETSPA